MSRTPGEADGTRLSWSYGSRRSAHLSRRESGRRMVVLAVIWHCTRDTYAGKILKLNMTCRADSLRFKRLFLVDSLELLPRHLNYRASVCVKNGISLLKNCAEIVVFLRDIARSDFGGKRRIFNSLYRSLFYHVLWTKREAKIKKPRLSSLTSKQLPTLNLSIPFR